MAKINTREQAKIILDMRNEFKPNAEIAEVLGVTEQTIKSWVKKLRDAGYMIPRSKLGRKKRTALDLSDLI
jgi:biotin operon repressor